MPKPTEEERQRAPRNSKPSLGQAVERCARLLRTADVRAAAARLAGEARAARAEQESRDVTALRVRAMLDTLSDADRAAAVGALALLGLEAP